MQTFQIQASALLTPSEAASELQVSTGTLQVWRSTGRHKLPFVKVGGCVRYRRSDIEAWLDQRTQTNGATV